MPETKLELSEDVLRILAESRLHPEHFMPRVEDAYSISVKKQCFVLVTRAQAEKKAQENLRKIGIDAYCPFVTRWSPMTKGQIKRGHKRVPDIPRPLFNRYLFVAMPVASSGIPFGEVSGLKDAICFISNADGPIPISKAIVDDIRAREEAGEFDLTKDVDRNGVPEWCKPGTAAYIGAGPFASIGQVLIDEIYPSGKIDVRGNVLGKETKITVQADWLKKSNNP